MLAQSVTEAMQWFPVPVTMVGFDARAVAMAVRRALGYSTVWGDHTFELIHPGPLPPALHAALDQVLTEELAAGRRGPTLRFWEWVEPAVIIGSFQSLRNEVDLAAVAELRHHGRPADLGRGRDVHGGGELHHVLDGGARALWSTA